MSGQVFAYKGEREVIIKPWVGMTPISRIAALFGSRGWAEGESDQGRVYRGVNFIPNILYRQLGNSNMEI